MTRYYDQNKLLGLKVQETDLTIAYTRVSSHDQKEDLKRQANLLSFYCAAHGWILKTGSFFNLPTACEQIEYSK